MASDSGALLTYLKSKNPDASPADLLDGVAELQAQGFEVPSTVHNFFRENVAPVVDKVTGAMASGMKGADAARLKSWGKMGAGNTEAFKTIESLQGTDHYTKGAELLNPLEAVKTPERTAVAGATALTSPLGTGPLALLGRVGATTAAGGLTGALTEEGDMIGGATGGALSGFVAHMMKRGLTPDEQARIQGAIERAAPWLRNFFNGRSQDELVRLGKSPEAVRRVLGHHMDQAEQHITSHLVNGQPVGRMQFQIPGLSQEVPGTVRNLISRNPGTLENITVDQALRRLRTMEYGPARDAAERAFVQTLNQIAVPAGRVPLGDAYSAAVAQYAKGMDAHRWMQRTVQLGEQMQHPIGTEGFSAGVPSGGRFFANIGSMFKKPESPVSMRKARRALQTGGDLDPAFSPEPWRTTGLIGRERGPVVIPTITGLMAGSYAGQSGAEE